MEGVGGVDTGFKLYIYLTGMDGIVEVGEDAGNAGVGGDIN